MVDSRMTVAVSVATLLSAVLLAVPSAKFLVMVIGLMFASFIMTTPFIGLLLFVFVAAFIPFSTVEFGIRITLSEALLALTWLGVLLGFRLDRTVFTSGGTEKALTILMIFSFVPFIVGQMTVHADGNGIVNWVRWLLNLSVFFLVFMLAQTSEKRRQLVIMLLLGSLCSLVLSISMFLIHRDANSMIPVLATLRYANPESVQDIFSGNFSRMASPWVHPNSTGGALILILPVAFYFGLTQQGWQRWLGFTVTTLAAMGLLFSISRGAILSFGIVLAWLAYMRAPHALRAILVATVLGILLVLSYEPLQTRLSTMFSGSGDASTSVRFDEYRRFPDAVMSFPMGIGFKSDPPVEALNEFGQDKVLLGISNLWLNYVYKIGFIGMIIFVAITLRWWREVKPRSKLNEVNRDNALWLGSLAAVLSALMTGLFDHYFSFTFVLIALFWMLIAINLLEARELVSQRKLQGVQNDET